MDQFYQQPPSYQTVRQKLYELNREYPFLKLFSIGRSVLGRKLFALGLGNLQNATAVVAAIHGQEWLTTLLSIRFAEDLCWAVRQRTAFCGESPWKVLEQKGLIVIPLANPDGVEIGLYGASAALHLRAQVERMLCDAKRSWQANARGVDLNHNFNAGFTQLKAMEMASGITRPCERQFGGYAPHSEPETKALVNLCLGLRVKRLIALHSQGEEIYYHYGDHTPFDALELAEQMAAVSGYCVAVPNGMASHGGLKDWFIQQTGRNGFTVEVGKGENPLPVEDFLPVYQKVKPLLWVGMTA